MELLDAKKTAALIVSIGKSSARMNENIHVAACSALAHHAEHGDVTLLNKLVAAMPKAARRNALYAWALAFDGRLQMNLGKDKADREANPLKHAKGDGTVDIAGACEMPFWDYAPESQSYHQFDLDKALQALLKRAQKAMEEEAQDTALIAPDKLAALRALTSPDESIKVVPVEHEATE